MSGASTRRLSDQAAKPLDPAIERLVDAIARDLARADHARDIEARRDKVPAAP